MGLFSGLKSAVSGLLGSGDTGSTSTGTGWALAGLSLLDSGLNSLSNSFAASQNWKYDKKLMDYQNQYNLPVNMRARLEEAGYNPNLALNGVNVQSASSSASAVQPTKFGLASVALQLYNMELQNQLLESQIEQVDSLTENNELKGDDIAYRQKFRNDTGLDYDDKVAKIYRIGRSFGNVLSHMTAIPHGHELENQALGKLIANRQIKHFRDEEGMAYVIIDGQRRYLYDLFPSKKNR